MHTVEDISIESIVDDTFSSEQRPCPHEPWFTSQNYMGETIILSPVFYPNLITLCNYS